MDANMKGLNPAACIRAGTKARSLSKSDEAGMGRSTEEEIKLYKAVQFRYHTRYTGERATADYTTS